MGLKKFTAKRLVVETDTKVIIEHHTNTEACYASLNRMIKRFNVKKYAIKDTVPHIEIKEEPKLTLVPYSEVK